MGLLNWLKNRKAEKEEEERLRCYDFAAGEMLRSGYGEACVTTLESYVDAFSYFDIGSKWDAGVGIEEAIDQAKELGLLGEKDVEI